MQKQIERVKRFLDRHMKAPAWNFSKLSDPRAAHKVRHGIGPSVRAMVLGMVTGTRTLRDLEAMTAKVATSGFVPRPISDTALYNLATKLDPGELGDMLAAQVRAFQRNKQLRHDVLPISLLAIDGKRIGKLAHDAQGLAQKRNSDNSKFDAGAEPTSPYWLALVLRATVVSCSAKPCVMQMPLLKGANEASSLRTFVEELQAAYGRSDLVDTVSLDAGFTTIANATMLADEFGVDYIMGLKDNQPTLLAEAQRVLGEIARTQPAEEETLERRGSRIIKRQIWRTTEMRGFPTTAGDWTTIRQTWYVRQTSYDPAAPDVPTSVEHRYFITSSPSRRLTAAQCLAAVRLHWGTENDVFNSLDLQWREDDMPWCAAGTAIWALSLIRLMAYNLVQLLRRRYQKGHNRHRPAPWRQTFEMIRDSLIAWSLPDREVTAITG